MRLPLLFVCVLASCPNTNLPATSLTSSQVTVATVVSTSGSALTESGALDMQAAEAATSAPRLALLADSWKLHVRDQIMPFWMMPSAKGRTEKSPFPSYRCRGGAAYGEGGCDFADLKRINRQVRIRDKHDGPFEWLTGPENELLSRNYIRMHSRQTYAYGVAYHLTGDPKYLKLAHRGVEWLLANAGDKNHGGSYTYLKHGTPDSDYKLRTSQDQSYSLLGLAFY